MSEWRELDDFEQALGILQGWIGRKVSVSVDAAGGPMYLAVMVGTLKAGENMVALVEHDVDEDLYEFGFDDLPYAEFMVHRRWFKGASYKDDELQVSMGSDAEVYTSITLRDDSDS